MKNLMNRDEESEEEYDLYNSPKNRIRIFSSPSSTTKIFKDSEINKSQKSIRKFTLKPQEEIKVSKFQESSSNSEISRAWNEPRDLDSEQSDEIKAGESLQSFEPKSPVKGDINRSKIGNELVKISKIKEEISRIENIVKIIEIVQSFLIIISFFLAYFGNKIYEDIEKDQYENIKNKVLQAEIEVETNKFKYNVIRAINLILSLFLIVIELYNLSFRNKIKRFAKELSCNVN
mmetsp:Transcript_14457/g.12734  ORF Transcript_14457/g.12734 Transcript_14457/m.12734 type:complete len:233 (+) Transcript_14457:204-902(+)